MKYYTSEPTPEEIKKHEEMVDNVKSLYKKAIESDPDDLVDLSNDSFVRLIDYLDVVSNLVVNYSEFYQKVQDAALHLVKTTSPVMEKKQ